MVEHRPRVEFVAGGDLLRAFQIEAADEHAQPAKHRLLGRREQTVAPFERGAQRLVTTQREAMARRQQAQPFAEPRVQAVDAQQRHARGGQLDRQRQAVELPADVDHRRQVVLVDHEARIGRVGARLEQRHRAGVARVRCVAIVGQRERVEPMHVFVGELQRLLRRHHDAHAVRVPAAARAPARPPPAAGARSCRARAGTARRAGARPGPWAAHRPPSCSASGSATVGTTSAASPIGASSISQTPSSNAARWPCASACASAVLPMPAAPTIDTSRCWSTSARKRRQIAVAPVQRRSARRASCRLCTSPSPQRPIRRRTASACGRSIAAPSRPDRHRESIAAPRNRGDRLRSEQLAQRADLHLQVVLLHHHARPDDVEQLVLGHQPIAPLVQRLQHVERARTELGARPSIHSCRLVLANLDADARLAGSRS